MVCGKRGCFIEKCPHAPVLEIETHTGVKYAVCGDHTHRVIREITGGVRLCIVRPYPVRRQAEMGEK